MALKIDIKKEELGEDPSIATYHVRLDNGRGEWTERYTRSELDVFLRGVQAGACMSDNEHVTIPEIPR